MGEHIYSYCALYHVILSFVLMLVSLLMCRTPEWLKKMFSTITKSERKGPVFRFFMDLGDAGALTVPFVSNLQ